MKPLGCECSDCPRCNGALNRLELIAEGLEATHLWLDDKNIPRYCKDTAAEYSLICRVMLYKDT